MDTDVYEVVPPTGLEQPRALSAVVPLPQPLINADKPSADHVVNCVEDALLEARIARFLVQPNYQRRQGVGDACLAGLTRGRPKAISHNGTFGQISHFEWERQSRVL